MRGLKFSPKQRFKANVKFDTVLNLKTDFFTKKPLKTTCFQGFLAFILRGSFTDEYLFLSYKLSCVQQSL